MADTQPLRECLIRKLAPLLPQELRQTRIETLLSHAAYSAKEPAGQFENHWHRARPKKKVTEQKMKNSQYESPSRAAVESDFVEIEIDGFTTRMSKARPIEIGEDVLKQEKSDHLRAGEFSEYLGCFGSHERLP